jgi:hypothetical protein
VNAGEQHDLDDKGIAKNAREEKLRAREAKLKLEAENAKMAKLYREHVLGEKPMEGFVGLDQLGGLKPPAKPAAAVEEKKEEVFGDD